MTLDFLLLIIAFRYLQTHLQTKTLYPEKKDLFFKGLLLSIALLAISVVFSSLETVAQWLALLLNFGLVYAAYTRREFLPLKPFVYAVFPLLVVHFAALLVKTVSESFYDDWNELFETAGVFAWIWLIAQILITRKQRINTEKEKIVAIQKEVAFKNSQRLKDELEIQVAERTAELTAQKEELIVTLNELKATQSQLIQSEKMASLGELTAGIAHEIQNPLNFVTNFAELNKELLEELSIELDKDEIDEAKVIVKDILANSAKIHHHGKRADAIVKGMLQHSRTSTGTKEMTDINELADEFLRLSYHGLRAKDKSFNATMETELDQSIGKLELVSQDIGRVILNLLNNAFYAVNQRKMEVDALNLKFESQEIKYIPTVWLTTKKTSKGAEIIIRDNGTGMPEELRDKVFQPFFTTKPTGQGTGLGLSLSFDIIKAHGGKLSVLSQSKPWPEESYTEFTIELPQ